MTHFFMMFCMSTCIFKEHQVFQTVIVFLFIYMVYDFFWLQWSAYVVFHYEPMLKNVPIISGIFTQRGVENNVAVINSSAAPPVRGIFPDSLSALPNPRTFRRTAFSPNVGWGCIYLFLTHSARNFFSSFCAFVRTKYSFYADKLPLSSIDSRTTNAAFNCFACFHSLSIPLNLFKIQAIGVSL